MQSDAADIGENPRTYARWVMHAAQLGDTDAQATLAQLLLDGRGVQKDEALALSWFRIAARQRHPMAINMIGRCLENGWGCVIDLADAAQHYRQAADLGLDWGLYNYGQLLTGGRGVERDLGAAYALFAQAADKGHAKSMNLLGRFHHEGVVVPKDVRLAKAWYQRAAQAGDFRGQYNHAAELVAEGDEAQACAWLERALATATPGFLQAAYPVLLGSASSAIRDMGLRYQRQALAT
ncbi:sel1 repeat family protein [Pseudomonas fluorescens]|uniref:tetratricopeptide repeat protein n=1 Tax=Pseudomonas fluorescens TaxID=294 RepID=UPI0019043E5A|nr:tetratricopeptide repeat protein [Pseudomonas fluorescens]MBD8092790.1 sel1 repeat family protein [Pseudomonas fluorescens]MBD8719356.1 sel1 repeat family protein [Pseudomonas fluorescens]